MITPYEEFQLFIKANYVSGEYIGLYNGVEYWWLAIYEKNEFSGKPSFFVSQSGKEGSIIE